MGSVVVEDVGGSATLLGIAWAMLAAAVGLRLAVAAATLRRRGADDDVTELGAGYNALAAVVDRR